MNTSLSIDPKRRDKIQIDAGALKEGMTLSTGGRVVKAEIWPDADVISLTVKHGHYSADTTLPRGEKVEIFD